MVRTTLSESRRAAVHKKACKQPVHKRNQDANNKQSSKKRKIVSKKARVEKAKSKKKPVTSPRAPEVETGTAKGSKNEQGTREVVIPPRALKTWKPISNSSVLYVEQILEFCCRSELDEYSGGDYGHMQNLLQCLKDRFSRKLASLKCPPPIDKDYKLIKQKFGGLKAEIDKTAKHTAEIEEEIQRLDENHDMLQNEILAKQNILRQWENDNEAD